MDEHKRGEAINLEGKDEKIKHLKSLKSLLNPSTLEELSVGDVRTAHYENIAYYFRELGRKDLSERIYSEAGPKVAILSIQHAVGKIDGDIDADRLRTCISYFGHMARRATQILERHCPDNPITMPALKFCAEVNVLIFEVGMAAAFFSKIGDIERAEEVMASYNRFINQPDERNQVHLYIETHVSEICGGIRKAYADFIRAVKDTKEFNTDLEKFLKEMLVELDNI